MIDIILTLLAAKLASAVKGTGNAGSAKTDPSYGGKYR